MTNYYGENLLEPSLHLHQLKHIKICKSSQALKAYSKKNQQIFISVLEKLPYIIWTTTPVGIANYFNQACIDYFGFSLKVISNGAWHSRIFPMDLANLLQQRTVALRTNKNVALTCRLLQRGNYYNDYLVKIIPSSDTEGKITQLIYIAMPLNKSACC